MSDYDEAVRAAREAFRAYGKAQQGHYVGQFERTRELQREHDAALATLQAEAERPREALREARCPRCDEWARDFPGLIALAQPTEPQDVASGEEEGVKGAGVRDADAARRVAGATAQPTEGQERGNG